MKFGFIEDNEIPTITNELFITKTHMGFFPAIIDSVKIHYDIYKKWTHQHDIDIYSRWLMVTNKIFCNIRLHDNGNDIIEFTITVDLNQAELFLEKLGTVAIVDEQQLMVFGVQVPLTDLENLINTKKALDMLKDILPDNRRFLDR